MPLPSGTRLGVYEVIGPLGAGGMGEVYRARDTTLGRDVALKLLPEVFATDPERVARFEREAQVLASFNHPHIAQIYGVQQAGRDAVAGGPLRALVMELVEGPTLAELITSGRGDAGKAGLSVEEALRIARQMALALEAAHDRGITHRDLKPSNIKIAQDGTVKVLDFGLAKLSSPLDSSSRSQLDLSASPTLTSPALATGAGVILGTAAYMSPEQARGKAVDKRADIWAFGCVLFEMLTGRRAFDGEDVSDTLAAVLRGEPDWSLIPSGVSPTLLLYLRRCLARDPAQRVHDIGDVRLALEGAFDVPAEAVAAPAVAETRRLPRWALAAVVGTLAAGVGLGFFLGPLVSPARPAPMFRLTATPVTGINPTGGDPDLAISPDGTRLAYVLIEQGNLALFVRKLDQLEPVRIEVLNSPRSPFFSPDGEWIGFFDGDALKRVSVNGGPAVTIAPVTGPGRGGSWGADDSIVYATADASTGLMRVPAGGGDPMTLTKPKPGEDHILPQFLPGERAVIFTVWPQGRTVTNAQIAVLNLESGSITPLISGGSHARYAASGHLVYGVNGTLRAIGFDLGTLTTHGNPAPVTERVVTKGTGPANFDLSANGSLAYMSGDAAGGLERSLVWVDRQGREEVLPAPKRPYTYPRISPDGSRLALDIRDQENDIWIWDFARQTLTRLTFDPAFNRGVAWTPDGRRLVFSAERDGSESVFWQTADGSGSPEQLTEAKGGRPQIPYSVTHDGSLVLFGEPGQPPFDLYTVQVNADRKIAPLLDAKFSETNGEVSPDGRWLAYQSDESGSNEIYVRPFPNIGEGRWQVSAGGGTRPAWARSGRELFYLKGDGSIVLVPVERGEGGAFSAGVRVPLFQGQYFSTQAGRTYDVSPDAKRFLMIKTAASANASATPQLVVVLNWTEDLKRLLPAE